MSKWLIALCVLLPMLACKLVLAQSKSNEKESLKTEIAECKRAGGEISELKECDGSLSYWCKISEKEQCYADQVKDGKCTVGRYDEVMGGIVGITPRVLCDKEQ